MDAAVVDNVLDLIGHTPLVKLRHLSPEGGATVWAKCEHLNPGGSVKDRICLAMIEAAERSGELAPGQPVVEPTSGNTGIGLALVCAVKGHPLILTMPESMSLERRALLEAYGGSVVPQPLADAALAEMRAGARADSALLANWFAGFFLSRANARAAASSA